MDWQFYLGVLIGMLVGGTVGAFAMALVAVGRRGQQDESP